MSKSEHAQEIRTKTVCPYCGVGCGVIATRGADGVVQVEGDPEHPANHGRLCSKGAALGETVDLDGRLLHPQVDGERCDWDTALDAAATRLNAIIERHGPEAVAFYVSGQLLTEDYYVVNKLVKGFLGTAHIDTNSRLCMSSAVMAHKRAFGSDTVPACYEDLERAKLVVLAGSNMAWCHPVLYQRLADAKAAHPDLAVVVIDPRRTASVDLADLHLPIRPGTDAWLWNGLLVHLAETGEGSELFQVHCEGIDEALAAARASAPDLATVAATCGLDEGRLREFYRLWARTERVVTCYSQGLNQTSSGTDKLNAILNCHLYSGRIGRPGSGPLSLTGQTNAMGGREVGGLATMLAAHMDLDDPEARERLARFWGVERVADRPGPKAVDLFEQVRDGRIKAVWIACTNPVVSLPDADLVREALSRAELVVVQESEARTDTTSYAHILLPALTWGEKEGTVTNSERRISRTRAFLPAPGEAKADWWIFTQLARRLGHAEAFPYERPYDVFREYAALTTFENDGRRDLDLGPLAELDEAGYDALTPVQWPLRPDGSGRARLFGDGRFYHADGRARLVPVTPRGPANPPETDWPAVLNTGRIRDQWHTMTRTGRAPRLNEHDPEPFVAVHPEDIRLWGLEEGGLARIRSRWGEALVRVRAEPGQGRGQVFAPMHWSDRFASCARINRVVNPDRDPVSGQPEFKHTPVRLEAVRPAWEGFLLSRRLLDLPGLTYWARVRGEGHYRYELAGEQTPDDWAAWARALLCAKDGRAEWVEYLDRTARRYRGVRLVDGALESALFIGPREALPARGWLASLFAEETLDPATRRYLLSGKPPPGTEDTGPTVCACMNVGRNTLIRAIEQGAHSEAALSEATGAGTGCGACRPELHALLAEMGVAE